MKTTFEYLDTDSAIQRLRKLKRSNKKKRITICTIDFDNDLETIETAVPDEGCLLVRKSKTIIINEDEYISHMQLYSILQNDIKNINKTGTMHDIIWGSS